MKEKNMNNTAMKIDEETGEVLLDREERDLIALLKEDKAPPDLSLEDYLNQVGDRITSKLERAKRLREQAERRAAPLEKSANYLLDCIAPVLRILAEEKLPRFQSGKKAGEFKSKTLDLETCRFAFRKAGGTFVFDPDKAIEYIKSGTDIDLDLLSCLSTKTVLDEKALLKVLTERDTVKDHLDFVTISEVDEFATVKCEVD
jgi:hypothetical protein